MGTGKPSYATAILLALAAAVTLLQLIGVELPFSISASAILGQLE